METLSLFKNIKGQVDFHSVTLLLDLEQGPFQVGPEVDLLQNGSRCQFTVQFSELVDKIECLA